MRVVDLQPAQSGSGIPRRARRIAGRFGRDENYRPHLDCDRARMDAYRSRRGMPSGEHAGPATQELRPSVMNITGIDCCVLTVPTSKQMALEFPHHKLVVAQIATDEGMNGLGYSLVFGGGGGGASAVLAYLEERLKPLLIGEDPLSVERLWEKMYRGDRGVRRVGIAGMSLSALDIGLWDIAGKAAKLPLFKLWGAVTDTIDCYGSGGWAKYADKDLVAEAERYAAMGCRYYKMKIHDPDPAVNRKRVETVRKALGPGVRMMVDVNQKLDVVANIRQARMLEDFDLVWYEEPVLSDDNAACAEVARSIRIPVATGENHYTR